MIVFVKKTGGQLGNRLFTFAHIYAFCLEHGFEIVHIGFEEYAVFFQNTRPGMCVRVPCSSTDILSPSIRKSYVKLLRLGMSFLMKLPFRNFFMASVTVGGEGDPFNLDDKTFVQSLQGKKLLRLEGFVLRAHTLFGKHAQEIRSFFVPEPQIQERVHQTICKARQGAGMLIGVHIRRGDYKDFEGGRFYFDIERYAKLMRSVSGLFANKRVRFLICSNEILRAEEFEGLDVCFGAGHLVEDLYSLAACDLLLGTRSTFVMWASFYGQVPLYRFDDPERVPSLSEFHSDWS